MITGNQEEEQQRKAVVRVDRRGRRAEEHGQRGLDEEDGRQEAMATTIDRLRR